MGTHSSPSLEGERSPCNPGREAKGSFGRRGEGTTGPDCTQRAEEPRGCVGVQCREAGSGGRCDRALGTEGGRSAGGWLPQCFTKKLRRAREEGTTGEQTPILSLLQSAPRTQFLGLQPGASALLSSSSQPAAASPAHAGRRPLLTSLRSDTRPSAPSVFLCISCLLPRFHLLKSHPHTPTCLARIPLGASPPGRVAVAFPALAHSCS